MNETQLDPVTIPGNLLSLITSDPLQVRQIPVWDPNPPAGWLIVALGPINNVVVCPKPCGNVHLPPPQQ